MHGMAMHGGPLKPMLLKLCHMLLSLSAVLGPAGLSPAGESPAGPRTALRESSMWHSFSSIGLSGPPCIAMPCIFSSCDGNCPDVGHVGHVQVLSEGSK